MRALARFYINRSTRCDGKIHVVCAWVYDVRVSVFSCNVCWESAEWRRRMQKNNQHQLKVNSIQVRRRSEMFALLKCYFKRTDIACSMNVGARGTRGMSHYFISYFCRYKYNNQFLYSNCIKLQCRGCFHHLLLFLLIFVVMKWKWNQAHSTAA